SWICHPLVAESLGQPNVLFAGTRKLEALIDYPAPHDLSVASRLALRPALPSSSIEGRLAIYLPRRLAAAAAVSPLGEVATSIRDRNARCAPTPASARMPCRVGTRHHWP